MYMICSFLSSSIYFSTIPLQQGPRLSRMGKPMIALSFYFSLSLEGREGGRKGGRKGGRREEGRKGEREKGREERRKEGIACSGLSLD